MFSSIAMVLVVSAVYLLALVLVIIFVVSHKRIASAHQELADAQKDIARQLANIAIELRHKNA